jgi:hypothetical protein
MQTETACAVERISSVAHRKHRTTGCSDQVVVTPIEEMYEMRKAYYTPSLRPFSSRTILFLTA